VDNFDNLVTIVKASFVNLLTIFPYQQIKPAVYSLNLYLNLLIMNNIKIATAQFENKSGDKQYNLSAIDELSLKASMEGAQAIAFHECSVTGYTFARHLTREQMLDIAEPFFATTSPPRPCP